MRAGPLTASRLFTGKGHSLARQPLAEAIPAEAEGEVPAAEDSPFPPPPAPSTRHQILLLFSHPCAVHSPPHLPSCTAGTSPTPSPEPCPPRPGHSSVLARHPTPTCQHLPEGSWGSVGLHPSSIQPKPALPPRHWLPRSLDPGLPSVGHHLSGSSLPTCPDPESWSWGPPLSHALSSHRLTPPAFQDSHPSALWPLRPFCPPPPSLCSGC